jgi:UPF0716 protein FxsA
MVLLILFILIAVPILEIVVFIEVGGTLGIAATLAIVLLTAIAGTVLLRHQGLATLARVRTSLERGRLPMAEVFDGLCLLVAGALLLTPGFVTDSAGLLLFYPPFRNLLRRALGRYLAASGRIDMTAGGSGMRTNGDSSVIDGEYRDVTAEDPSDKDLSDEDRPHKKDPPELFPPGN